MHGPAPTAEKDQIWALLHHIHVTDDPHTHKPVKFSASIHIAFTVDRSGVQRVVHDEPLDDIAMILH